MLVLVEATFKFPQVPYKGQSTNSVSNVMGFKHRPNLGEDVEMFYCKFQITKVFHTPVVMVKGKKNTLKPEMKIEAELRHEYARRPQIGTAIIGCLKDFRSTLPWLIRMNEPEPDFRSS